MRLYNNKFWQTVYFWLGGLPSTVAFQISCSLRSHFDFKLLSLEADVILPLLLIFFQGLDLQA